MGWGSPNDTPAGGPMPALRAGAGTDQPVRPLSAPPTSISRVTTRLTPYDLVFAPMAEERFPPIRTGLAAAGSDPLDRDAFLLTPEAAQLVHDLRPDEGLGEEIDRLAALVHHAFLFWDAGSEVVTVDRGVMNRLLDPQPAPLSLPPATVPYVQVPERLIWAQALENQPHEPLDGWFAHLAPRGRLRALAILGLHPDRMGFTVWRRRDPDRWGWPGRTARRCSLPRFPAATRPGCARSSGRRSFSSWRGGRARPERPTEWTPWTRERSLRCWSRSPPSWSSRAITPSGSVRSGPPPGPSPGSRARFGRRWKTALWPEPRASGRLRSRSSASSPPRGGRPCSRSCASRSRPAWLRCSPSPASASPRSGRFTSCSTSTRCPSWRRRRWTDGSRSCRASGPRLRKTSSAALPICARRRRFASRTTRPKRPSGCSGRWTSSRVWCTRSSPAMSGAGRSWFATWSSSSWPTCRRRSCSSG